MKNTTSATALVLEGLSSYAVERQAGFETHRADPARTNQEQREQWCRGILHKMKLEARPAMGMTMQ